jgi:hypothetical protein
MEASIKDGNIKSEFEARYEEKKVISDTRFSFRKAASVCIQIR